MKSRICIIGAANMDITGYSRHKIIAGDSNIGSMKITTGGVARNIAENLVRLGVRVHLLSVFGGDALSRSLWDDCKEKGMDISGSILIKSASCPSFLAIMDSLGDLAVGIAAMDIYERIPDEFIHHATEAARHSEYTVLETNLPENILSQIITSVPGGKFIVDTVSGDKAGRIRNLLNHIYILKTNRREAEILSGTKNADAGKSAEFFLNAGVDKVFITLGSEGVLYADAFTSGILPPVKVEKIVNTTGAGDAFLSGVIFGEMQGASIREEAEYGLKCAALTVQSELTVSPLLHVEKIK